MRFREVIMAEFTLSKSTIIAGKKREPSTTLGNIAYAVFVLFCFWVGSQILNMLVNAPGVFEHLMQLDVKENGRPHIEIGMLVGTIFGLVPFLVGSLIAAAISLWLRFQQRRY
jgi:hypothetical protein